MGFSVGCRHRVGYVDGARRRVSVSRSLLAPRLAALAALAGGCTIPEAEFEAAPSVAPLGTASGTLPLVPWARGRGPYRLVPWQRRASCRGTGACPDGGACVWAHCFHPPRDPAEAVPVMRRTEHTGQPVRQLRARWRYTLVDGRGLTRGRLDTGLPGSGGPAEYLVVDDESRAGASGTAVRVEYAVHVTWDQTDRLQLHARDWVGTARNPTACPGWIPGTCLDWELPDLPPNRWITLGRSEVRDFRGRLGAPAHEPQRWWSGPGAPP